MVNTMVWHSFRYVWIVLAWTFLWYDPMARVYKLIQSRAYASIVVCEEARLMVETSLKSKTGWWISPRCNETVL